MRVKIIKRKQHFSEPFFHESDGKRVEIQRVWLDTRSVEADEMEIWSRYRGDKDSMVAVVTLDSKMVN
jgi:hypothetical protein